MAAEQGLSVDEDGFRRLMTEQRQRAKADAQAKKHGPRRHRTSTARSRTRSGAPVEFTGYDEVVSRGDGARPGGRRRGGARTARRGRGGRGRARPHAVLRRGRRPARRRRASSSWPSGAVAEVDDVQTPDQRADRAPGARAVRRGRRSARPPRAQVDIAAPRGRSRRAHTATHMVHKAMREALGETATQAGSENAPGRLPVRLQRRRRRSRASVLRDVEAEVNAKLLDDLPVYAEVMTQHEAVDSGAMALFGEKYGDAGAGRLGRGLGARAVRRHPRSALRPARRRQAALGESSIGSGVRRVEALVGADAYELPRAREPRSSASSPRRSRRAPRSCPSGSTRS